MIILGLLLIILLGIFLLVLICYLIVNWYANQLNKEIANLLEECQDILCSGITQTDQEHCDLMKKINTVLK